MKDYINGLYARLEELSEKPLTLGRIEEADAVAGLLCRLHKLDGMDGDHFRESAKMMTLTEQEAEVWIQNLENDDPRRPNGPMWTEQECISAADSAGVDRHGIPDYIFWAAMNMEWSDGWAVARDYGIDQSQYYARLAERFLRDKDGPGPVQKIARYYHCVVCRKG